MKFDKKDRIILESLFMDCRIPLKELSRRTNLTHPAVLYRIRKYEEDGLILKYDAIIDLNKFETPFRILLVSVPVKFKKNFESYCLKNRAIMSVIRHIHKFNYSITAPLTKKQEAELISYLKKNKLKCRNYKVVKTFPFHPCLFDDVRIPEKAIILSDKKLKLDDADIKIIEELYDGGGRDSVLELARRTRLNADLVLYRFKRLNKSGYFNHFSAQPNQEKFHIKYYILSFKVKDILVEDCLDIFKKTRKCRYIFQSEKNKYVATMVIRDLKELEETLEKIYDGFDKNLVSLEVYPSKNWLFLNRLDLEKVLVKKEMKYPS